MSRRGWKAVERTAADLFGLIRFPANMGGRLDFGPRSSKQPPFLGQVKNPRVQSLATLTKLAMEMEALADLAETANEFDDGRLYYGVVVTKLSNKTPTPHLVTMTEDTWMKLRKHLPFDWEIGARRKGADNGGQGQQEPTGDERATEAGS
jgi:hypothetical protein